MDAGHKDMQWAFERGLMIIIWSVLISVSVQVPALGRAIEFCISGFEVQWYGCTVWEWRIFECVWCVMK